MIKYNKNILYENSNVLSNLEKKYGEILTYNYNNIKEIKEYNNLNNKYLEYEIINRTNNKTITLGGETNKNKVLNLKEKTSPRRWKQLSYLCCFWICLFIFNIFSNAVYNYKLNGIIYPILLVLIITNLYIISKNSIKAIDNYVASGSVEITKAINKSINLLISSIRSLPNLIPNVPKIPQPDVNKSPFSDVRNNIQQLTINVKIDVNKYKLELTIPSMEFPFINPLAAICCAWEGFKKLLYLVYNNVIKPFVKLCKKIYNPIKKMILWFKKNFIDPIVNFIMKLWNGMKAFIEGFTDIFIDVISLFDWIPGLGDQIRSLKYKHKENKAINRRNKIMIKQEEDRQNQAYKVNKLATKKALSQANSNAKTLINEEQEGVNLSNLLNKASKIKRTKNKNQNQSQVFSNSSLSGGSDNKNIKINKSKNNLKDNNIITRNIDNKIEKYINISKKKLSECKNCFNIKNTNIKGFMKAFLIRKEKIKEKYYKKLKIIEIIKLKKITNKIKYLKKSNKKISLNNIFLKINKNIKNHCKKKIINIINKSEYIIKSANKLHKLGKNLKNNKVSYKNKIKGGWGLSPWELFKRAMRRLLDGVKSLVSDIEDAYNDLVKALSDVPKVVSHITSVFNKISILPTIFTKILNGITTITNWITNELPSFFEKILKIIANVGIIIAWFIKNVIKRGLLIIKTILEFILKLIEKTAKKMNIPGWASPYNPLLKLPAILEGLILILDLPFKDLFEKLTTQLKKVLTSIPTQWLKDILTFMKSLANRIKAIYQSTFDMMVYIVKAAIRAAARAVSFFGGDIYSLVPGLRKFQSYLD